MKSRIIPPLINCLIILVGALVMCPRSFAQTPDCDSALKNCRDYCNSNLRIYDRERGDYIFPQILLEPEIKE